MSQHKKQAKPTFINQVDKKLFTVNGVDEVQFTDGTKVKVDPSIPPKISEASVYPMIQETKLKSFLKAIYRDGATGTSRSLSKDVQTITELLTNNNQEAPGGTTDQTQD